MTDILYELYNGEYEIDTLRDEKEEEISQKMSELMEQMKEALGIDFTDRLSNLYIDYMRWSNYRYYREGFSLAARLMIEVFTSATA